MNNAVSLIRNILVRTIVLGMIFVGAVFFFARWINQTMPSTAEAMGNSTFPLVYMCSNGISYNCLHGYAQEMDVEYIRDTVTVLADDHVLDIRIQPFDTNIEGVSYEVLTLDGKESLENTNVIRLTEEDGYVTASLQIQNQILLGQEYILKLQVTAGGREIYFYTRLLLEDGLHLDEYLDFVTGFYEKCVNKTDQNALGTVVEPDETTGKSQTLASMDIHDTVSQLMWGELNPRIYYKPTPSLVDINGTTASFVLEYRISAVDADGVNEVYNVKEFYRLRYTDTRIFLLDFTRTTDEVFNPDGKVLDSEGINLGITGTDVEYMFDDRRKIVAFVQENELWAYHVNGDGLTRVFGFPQQTNMDYRDFYARNNIKILRVEESGDIWFAVSGYMNRGEREGQNGAGIYFFEESSSTVEEILFAETMESYDMLKLDIDALSYITNDRSACYFLLEGIVYRIDLKTGEYTRVIDGIRNDCFISSESNRYFSWLKEGSRYRSQTLYTMDFETGAAREVTCQPDEQIRPVSYMEEDLVYGIARSSDILDQDEGSEIFPMYRIVVEGSDGTQLMTYEMPGTYVVKAELLNHVLKLERVAKTETGYAETLEDQIVGMNTQDDVSYGVATRKGGVSQTEIVLRLGTSITDRKLQIVEGHILMQDGLRSIKIPRNMDREKLYYVYAGGKMESMWTTAAEAVRRADEKVGVVINHAKEFVWERGNRALTSKIKVENIPEIVRDGVMDVQALEAALGKDVVNLTGCTLEQVLYFVGQGQPVLAATPDGGTVVITGYDDFGNTILLRPGETETYFYGPQDSKALFEEAGNRFVSYLKTDL